MTAESKTALISGVSGGLGGDIARFLLADDWDVHGLSRTKPDFKHERFFWQEADLAQPAKLRGALSSLRQSFDALILAAGMSGPVGPGLILPLDGWRETFEVNFFAPLAIAKEMFVRLRPNACIIFFSGGGAANARPLVGPYAASKLAAVKLAEQLALDHKGFRFYAIAPGAHDTKIFREQRAGTGEPAPKFAEFSQVEKLIRTFISDTAGRLNGRFVHVRDDVEKLLSFPEGGMIRRFEAR